MAPGRTLSSPMPPNPPLVPIDSIAAAREPNQSDRFLRSIADHLPNYLSYWDRSGICQFANQRYLDLFGLTLQQVRGLSAAQLIGPQAAAEIADDVAAALAGQYRQRERVRQHQGQPMHLWVQFVPDLDDDQVKGYFVLGTDITPLKLAERELQTLNEELSLARDRAEAGTLAKSAFLSNVSHEIRTPLNAIIGLTHLMQRDNRETVHAERLGRLDQAAQHLLDVLNDVLDLSKIEAGKLALAASDFRLAAVVSKVCLMVADQARAKGIELVFEVDPSLPEAVCGDQTRVVQALLNLVSNAVKFTEAGSVVVRLTRQSQRGAGVAIRFLVSDTGIGVPPDKLSSLFTLFEQADLATARRFGGTGLGLAITRRLAELMGGEVGVSSQIGVGSQLWFSARFESAAAVGRARGTAASSSPVGRASVPIDQSVNDQAVERRALGRGRRSFHGLRVLLAEDNLINQEVALELLRIAGLNVDLAADGARAVDMARASAYDLILMDVQMPLLDGLQATREIRRMAQHVATPIVAMTANAFEGDRLACLASGMNDHLAKPVDVEALFDQLNRWLPEADLTMPDALPEAWAGASTNAGASDLAQKIELEPASRFSTVEGLDVTQTLVYLPGRDDILERVLGHFCGSYRNGLDELKEHIGQHRHAAAQRLVHALRGACGAVGAVALSAQAQTLEDLLLAAAEGEPPPPTALHHLASDLERNLLRLVAVIKVRLRPAGESATESAAAPAR